MGRLVAHQRLAALDPKARTLHDIIKQLYRLGETPDVEALALVVEHWPVGKTSVETPSHGAVLSPPSAV
jgi:hypothetical protein